MRTGTNGTADRTERRGLTVGRRRRRRGGPGRSDPPLVTDGGSAGDSDVAPEAMLRSADVLEPVPGGHDLRLTDEFADAWAARIEQMRDGNRALRWLAAGEELDPADLTVDDGEGFVVTHGDDELGAWHSEATFLADVVVEPTLREWVPESEFDRLPAAHRDELSASLLMFLERCPSCDGDLSLSESDADDGRLHVSLDCPACGATIAAGTHQ